MDDLLQKETERQRRLLEEARKAVEEEKARMRQGGSRRVEPRFDEPHASPIANSSASEMRIEPTLRNEAGREAVRLARGAQSVESSVKQVQPRDESYGRLRSIPNIRSALIPFDEEAVGVDWSKPFSLPKADMEPWLSFLRGYRSSCLFSDAASLGELRVDAAIQALLELKGLDLGIILNPAVQIDGPVEYVDEAGSDDEGHAAQLARAVEKGREMGDHLHGALLGEGYFNLVQAWEKVHNRKPNVSELHFMLTTGRVRPPADIQPRRSEPEEGARAQVVPTATVDAGRAGTDEVRAAKSESARPTSIMYARTSGSGFFSSLMGKLRIADKRKFLFHLSHLALVCAAIVVYCVVMRVFE